MVECFVHKDLPVISTSPAMAEWNYSPNICTEGLRKTTINFGQDSQCPGGDSNHIPPRFKSIPWRVYVHDDFWTPNVTCLGSGSLRITSFLHQSTLFGFFWHHLVTCLGFRDKEFMVDTWIWWSVVYSTANAASLLHFTSHTKSLLQWDTNYADRSLSLTVYCVFNACLLLWLLILVHFWSDSSSLICLCLKCSPPWSRFLAYRLGDAFVEGLIFFCYSSCCHGNTFC
jgi:hypothetical protein